MALCVKKNVLRLQVPVCYTLTTVQKLEDEADLGSVEDRCRLVKSMRSAQVGEYLSARTVVELAHCWSVIVLTARDSSSIQSCIDAHHLESLQP